MNSENEEGTLKHVTLSTDRPKATDPIEIFAEWSSVEAGNRGYLQQEEQAMFLIHRLIRGREVVEKYYRTRSKLEPNSTDLVGDKTPAVGSYEKIYSRRDYGFLETVLMAYNHHWNLRTSPDDWWYCVISKVARAIDENSKKESVRKMFVEHEGKKELTVEVPVSNIYDVDYSFFFDAMEREISCNVKVPEYVDSVKSDFSTTTPVQRIVSQIALMSSVQEFFEFVMRLMCGIPAIEMLGTEDDWKKLLSKLKVLKTVLEPIEKELGLEDKWWSHVKQVFTKLLETYRGSPDKKWWSHIISVKAFGSGPPPSYSGWFMEFLEGKVKVDEDKISSGLVSVPLTIRRENVKDKGTLVAGMIGYTVHEGAVNRRLSVQPFHGWSLLLSEDSPFRLAHRENAAMKPKRI